MQVVIEMKNKHNTLLYQHFTNSMMKFIWFNSQRIKNKY